jgi:hypothetical protein
MTVQARERGWAAGTDAAGGLVVRSPAGRVWYPSWAAEVEAGGDPARLIRVARTEPQRGTWRTNGGE